MDSFINMPDSSNKVGILKRNGGDSLVIGAMEQIIAGELAFCPSTYIEPFMSSLEQFSNV